MSNTYELQVESGEIIKMSKQELWETLLGIETLLERWPGTVKPRKMEELYKRLNAIYYGRQIGVSAG